MLQKTKCLQVMCGLAQAGDSALKRWRKKEEHNLTKKQARPAKPYQKGK